MKTESLLDDILEVLELLHLLVADLFFGTDRLDLFLEPGKNLSILCNVEGRVGESVGSRIVAWSCGIQKGAYLREGKLGSWP